jgi:hypothetical protein
MNEKDLERAFGSTSDKWTESQRRVVSYIEWLESKKATLETALTLFLEATSDAWLSEHLTND